MNITQTKTELKRNPNTKTTYKVISKEVETITEWQHHLCTCNETLKWFRRLGGKETVQRNYTNKVVKLISTSPDKQTKIVREFSLE